MSPTAAPVATTNPFVGPRAFARGEVLYGRDLEIAGLLDLLIAERIVLLYSPSGAGKTSLIEAGLIPKLEAEQFEVLPRIRVTHELPPDAHLRRPPNRYLMSTLLSLEEQVPPGGQRSLSELAAMSLTDYLAEWPDTDGRPGNEILIFDQFEEVLTADPIDQDAKHDFFADVGAALRNRDHWALFSMREDFLAGLDPYVRLLPTRLATRTRLDLLTAEAALSAMVNPARDAGVEFAPAAAEKLADDLRRVRVQRPWGPSEELGPYIEPVQLQVACRRLWDLRPEGALSIDLDNVEALGNVDTALADYFAEVTTTVAASRDGDERAIREWFEHSLITPQGFRGQVLSGPEIGDGSNRRVLQDFMDAHLVRAEQRRGATWYELAHDRLIQPVLDSNEAWRSAHLSPFQQEAALWEAQGHPDGLLLRGDALERAESSVSAQPEPLTPIEKVFLEESRKAHRQELRERRSAIWTRRLLAAAIVGLVVALVAALVAYGAARRADDKAQEADEQGRLARQQGLVAAASGNLPRDVADVDLGLLLAEQAATISDDRGEDLPSNVRDAMYEAVGSSPVQLVFGGAVGPATAIAISSDGGTVATATGRGAVHLWDSHSADELSTLPTSGAPVESLAFDEPGDRLAAGLDDGTVRLWDLASPESYEDFPQHGSGVDSVTFSTDGNLLISASGESAVKVRNLAEPTMLPDLRASTGINDVAFANGVIAGAGEDGSVVLWNASTSATIDTLPGDPRRAHRIRFSPDGSSLAVAHYEGPVTVWDVAQRAPRFGDIDTTGPGFVDVTFTGDGSRLAVVDRAGPVWTHRTSDGEDARELRLAGDFARMARFDPADPNRILVATTRGAPAVWDARLGHQLLISALDVSPQGVVATASRDDTVELWRSSGAPLASLPHGGDVTDVEFNPSGDRVATTATDGVLRLWTTEGSLLYGPPIGADVLSVSFNSDGDRLATGDETGAVRVWDVATGTEVGQPLAGHTARVISVAFSRRPNDDRLVSVGERAEVILWDASRSEKIRTLDVGGKLVLQAAFSPSGDFVATVGIERAVRLHDLESGRARVLEGHTKQINDVAFDAQGQRLATASKDHSAVVWDVDSGRRLRRIPNVDELAHVDFAPDGDRLWLTRFDGLPFDPPLDDRLIRREVRSRVTRTFEPSECRMYLEGRDCPRSG